MAAGIPRKNGTTGTTRCGGATGDLSRDYFSPAVLVCISLTRTHTFVCFRENQGSLVLLGIGATRGLQVCPASRVYLGLLGRKVERCDHAALTHSNHC